MEGSGVDRTRLGQHRLGEIDLGLGQVLREGVMGCLFGSVQGMLRSISLQGVSWLTQVLVRLLVVRVLGEVEVQLAWVVKVLNDIGVGGSVDPFLIGRIPLSAAHLIRFRHLETAIVATLS